MNRQGTMFVSALVLLLMLFASWRLEPGTKPNILLITIDTLRADHLGCYGYKSKTSPNLDQFAKQGVLFQNAYSAVPLTLPSHATILSGLYPKDHGIRDNAHFPLTRSPLIPETLKQLGYRTAAFVSGATLSSKFGLNRGFDFYDDEFAGTERKANETTIRVLQWMKNAQTPYFLWVHYFDPHAEYEPPDEFLKRFSASPYDGEIAFVDSEIPKLLNAAGSDAFVLLTADHGESLGEHGETTHAVFLYNATLHVPLIIRGPAIKPGIRTDPVSLCDIAPTILGWAGANISDSYDGASLLMNAGVRTLLAESLYAERNFGYAPLYASIRQGKKYILAPQAEFYDLKVDPAELHNLSAKSRTEEWKSAIQQYAKENRAISESPLSTEEQERFRSLGYVSGSVARTGVDPKTKIQVIERFRQGMIEIKKERYDLAERTFQEITKTEQKNGLAYRFLADALAAQHKYADAVRAYSHSLDLLPDPEVAVQLAKAYNRLNQTAQAETVLVSTVSRYPGYSEGVFELASFYASQQRWDAAFALLKIDSPEYHNQRGILQLQRKEPQQAMAEFQEAIQVQPKAIYWNNLGIASQQLHQFQNAEDAFQQALRLNPDYEECEANLSFLLVEQRRWEEALEHLRRITQRNPNMWRARLALAFTLENQGKYQDALLAYRKLLDDAPSDWPQRQQVESRIRSLTQ